MRIIATMLLLWAIITPVTIVCVSAPAEDLGNNSTSTEIIETIKPEVETEIEIETEIKPMVDISLIKPILPQLTPIEQIELEWAEEAEYLAKTIWGEARGISRLEQEKVVWCVLNRVDDPRFPDTIKGVITSGEFHGYSKSNPLMEEHYFLALEVIAKWLYEKKGGEIERPLESGYFYFYASNDGTYHIFRKEF